MGLVEVADRLGSRAEVVQEAVTSAAANRPARWIFDGKGTPLGEPTLAHETRIGASPVERTVRSTDALAMAGDRPSPEDRRRVPIDFLEKSPNVGRRRSEACFSTTVDNIRVFPLVTGLVPP